MHALISSRINCVDAKIGDRLMLGLAHKGMTAEQLAFVLRLDVDVVDAYCAGSARISASMLRRISDVTELPLHWFFSFDFKSLNTVSNTAH
jgi:transcriptional regulator with XRE-family HTH domain